MSLHSAQHPHKRQVEILGHGHDLRHLVVAMHLGKAGIGVQPGNWPSLDLARREDEVHGVRIGMRGGEIKKAPVRGASGNLAFPEVASLTLERCQKGSPIIEPEMRRQTPPGSSHRAAWRATTASANSTR